MRHFQKQDDMSSFRQAVLNRERHAVISLAATCDHEKVRDVFLEIGYDVEDLAIYDFVSEIIQAEETAQWHEIASLLLSQPLCHHTAAYERSFVHAKRAVALNSDDIGLKEYLLFFNVIPDKLLSDAEAEQLAQQILQDAPYSRTAHLHVFSESARKQLTNDD